MTKNQKRSLRLGLVGKATECYLKNKLLIPVFYKAKTTVKKERFILTLILMLISGTVASCDWRKVFFCCKRRRAQPEATPHAVPTPKPTSLRIRSLRKMAEGTHNCRKPIKGYVVSMNDLPSWRTYDIPHWCESCGTIIHTDGKCGWEIIEQLLTSEGDPTIVKLKRI